MDAFRRGAKRTSARPNRVHLANRFQTALIRIAGRSYVPTLMAEGLTIDSEETDCGQEGWMFGGVTQELLAKSQLCCLFSH